MSLSSLTDRDLLASLESLCRRERETTIDVLRHLNEVEARKLYLRLGYSSMFVYCTQALRYSESAAGRRIAAARCMRRAPWVERLLERREVSLMSLGLVANILTPGNAAELLERIRGKCKPEVARIVAEYQPEVVVRDRVRHIRVRMANTLGAVASAERRSVVTRAAASAGMVAPTVSTRIVASTALVTPTPSLTPALFVNEFPNSHGGSEKSPASPAQSVALLQLHFAVTPEFMATYHETCALLSNKISKISFATVFQALMEDYRKRQSPLARHARRVKRESRKAVGVAGDA